MPHVQLSVEQQNTNLYYELHGSGQTKILFIMGLLVDGSAWNCQTEFFGQLSEYQCVSYDNRGCGRSSAPRTLHYTTTQMAKDALGLVNHLNWSQCHVVGLSMGGMIALEFALMASHRILSLTLIATHAGGLSGRIPLAGFRHILRGLFLRDDHSLIQNTLAMLYGPKTLADPEKEKRCYNIHAERLRKCIEPPIIGVLGQVFAVFRHYIAYSDLLKIRYSVYPTLIIAGTEDRLVHKVNSYLLQRTLDCRLIVLQDAGHALPAERAQEINQELSAHFESSKHVIPISKSTTQVPTKYIAAVEALERCCHHRTHCFVHNTVGFLKGLALGLVLYWILSVGLTNSQVIRTNLAMRCIVFIGFLSGLRRAVLCVFNSFRARLFVRENKLLLDRVACEGGIDIALFEEKKYSIPYGCGFEFPGPSLVFIAGLIGLVYWTKLFEQQL